MRHVITHIKNIRYNQSLVSDVPHSQSYTTNKFHSVSLVESSVQIEFLVLSGIYFVGSPHLSISHPPTASTLL